MSERALRIGPIAGVFGLWAVFGAIASDVALFAVLPLVPPEISDVAVPAIIGAVAALSIGVATLALTRLRQVDRGVKGRARIVVGAVAMIVAAIAQAAFTALLWIALADPGYSALGLHLATLGYAEQLETARSSIETVAYAQGTIMPLHASGWLWMIAVRVQVVCGLSTWFLIPLRARKILWILVDVPLLAGFVFALWALPFVPQEDGDPKLPGIALAITTLFAFRAFARLLPPTLDVIERGGFQLLVAARMLRAKKSGFLTAIGLLSVLAVSFSSCTLTTTLSVMGGFRDDLQRKILGNNAHVVIDREYGTFEGWDPLIARVRAAPGVQGASPYVAGEVMVTSASNLGGVFLRGIDPTTIGGVTDLPRNMRMGRLEYLSDPERLLHLSVDEMSGSLLGDRPPPLPSDLEIREEIEGEPGAGTGAGTGEGAAPMPGPFRDEPTGAEESSLLRDLDRILGQMDERQRAEAEHGVAPPVRGAARDGDGHEIRTASGARVEVQDAFGTIDPADLGGRDGLLLGTPPPLQRPRDVLPGLIVGQELARSLRLHVGDEVNVVSPIGDLGPAGPIPRSRPFRVAGIFYSGMYEYDMKVAYTDLETAQRFLSTGDAISGVEVRVDDWEHAELAAAEIAQAIERPELRVRSWQEVNRNLFGALELEKLAMFITLGIAILVASFCIVGTLVLMVQEKGREVGILKAMGAEDAQIVAVFMMQGLFIGVVGAATGLGLGWVVCFAAEHLGIVPLNPEVYYIDRLPIHTDPREFVSVGVAAVVVCLLATIYPAILGSRLRPVDALRDA